MGHGCPNGCECIPGEAPATSKPDPRTVAPVEVSFSAISLALGILTEESAEVVCAISKILRFGLGRSPWKPERETNLESLENELGDVQAMMTILNRLHVIDLNHVRARAKAKITALMDEEYRAPAVRRALMDLELAELSQ